MIFGKAIPFSEAVQHLAAKELMPTGLSSAELRALDAGLRRQSLFSARTTIEGYLEEMRKVVGSVLNPDQVTRYDEDGRALPQTVTEGFNPTTARVELKRALAKFGYEPDEEVEGSLQDLSSDARIDLVVKTNVELAQGAGRFVQQNLNEDVVDLWPALELVRFEERDEPRDWPTRWRIAAQSVSDVKAQVALEFHGRMVALKSSGIWQALGDGAGGYQDTLGNPYPPFAFRSGMWTEEVSRDEAIELGLIQEGEAAEGAEFDLESLMAVK